MSEPIDIIVSREGVSAAYAPIMDAVLSGVEHISAMAGLAAPEGLLFTSELTTLVRRGIASPEAGAAQLVALVELVSLLLCHFVADDPALNDDGAEARVRRAHAYLEALRDVVARD